MEETRAIAHFSPFRRRGFLVPGRTVSRGYGARHKRLRQSWARRVEAGGVPCARCGRLIVPGSP